MSEKEMINDLGTAFAGMAGELSAEFYKGCRRRKLNHDKAKDLTMNFQVLLIAFTINPPKI